MRATPLSGRVFMPTLHPQPHGQAILGMPQAACAEAPALTQVLHSKVHTALEMLDEVW